MQTINKKQIRGLTVSHAHHIELINLLNIYNCYKLSLICHYVAVNIVIRVPNIIPSWPK